MSKVATHSSKEVPMSMIRPGSIGLRKVDTEGQQYLSIFESLPKVGLLNPPNAVFKSVQAVDDEGQPLLGEDNQPIIEEFYELCDGLHRYTACKNHGLETMQLTILDPKVISSETDVLVAQVVANLSRVDTKPIEYSRQLHRILKLNPTMTMVELAAKMGQSPSFIQGRLNLQKIENPEIQTRIDNGQISLSNASTLALLSVDDQLAFLEQAMTEPAAAFQPRVKQHLKEQKDAKAKGREASDEFPGVKPRLRKTTTLLEAIENPEELKVECKGLSTAEEIIAATLRWCTCQDSKSVADAKTKHEAVVASRKEAARRRSEDKERRNAEKAEVKAKKAQEAAVKAAEDAAKMREGK